QRPVEHPRIARKRLAAQHGPRRIPRPRFDRQILGEPPHLVPPAAFGGPYPQRQGTEGQRDGADDQAENLPGPLHRSTSRTMSLPTRGFHAPDPPSSTASRPRLHSCRRPPFSSCNSDPPNGSSRVRISPVAR